MKIEIAISTLNDGIHKIKFHPEFNYLIIHQITNDKNYLHYINSLTSNKIHYIPSTTTGLSKSRNIALRTSKSDYIWLMDDDVDIDSKAYLNLLEIMYHNSDIDMLVLSHSSEQKKQTFLPYSLLKINRYTAMSVSSIDMLIKRKSILEHKILFNEMFGLGTIFPAGEEFIFTTQMLNKGLSVYKINHIFSYHPPVASGHDFYSTTHKLEAKLKMFIFCYGNFSGRIIFFLFIIKKINILIKNHKFLSALKLCISSKNR